MRILLSDVGRRSGRGYFCGAGTPGAQREKARTADYGLVMVQQLDFCDDALRHVGREHKVGWVGCVEEAQIEGVGDR